MPVSYFHAAQDHDSYPCFIASPEEDHETLLKNKKIISYFKNRDIYTRSLKNFNAGYIPDSKRSGNGYITLSPESEMSFIEPFPIFLRWEKGQVTKIEYSESDPHLPFGLNTIKKGRTLYIVDDPLSVLKFDSCRRSAISVPPYFCFYPEFCSYLYDAKDIQILFEPTPENGVEAEKLKNIINKFTPHLAVSIAFNKQQLINRLC